MNEIEEKKNKKEKHSEEVISGLYYTKKEPRKSFATFMRNQNKVYVNSFNMIDRKAAIMIRVNAAIISAIVIFFDTVQHLRFGNFIGVIMVICSFVSLMFAINASRPHVFDLFSRFRRKVGSKHPNLEENIFGVGMFDQVTLEEYEAAYDKLVQSQELQIGNQIRTMYIFERQIKNAFLQIEIAYAAFMIGFGLVVIAFIWATII